MMSIYDIIRAINQPGKGERIHFNLGEPAPEPSKQPVHRSYQTIFESDDRYVALEVVPLIVDLINYIKEKTGYEIIPGTILHDIVLLPVCTALGKMVEVVKAATISVNVKLIHPYLKYLEFVRDVFTNLPAKTGSYKAQIIIKVNMSVSTPAQVMTPSGQINQAVYIPPIAPFTPFTTVIVQGKPLFHIPYVCYLEFMDQENRFSVPSGLQLAYKPIPAYKAGTLPTGETLYSAIVDLEPIQQYEEPNVAINTPIEIPDHPNFYQGHLISVPIRFNESTLNNLESFLSILPIFSKERFSNSIKEISGNRLQVKHWEIVKGFEDDNLYPLIVLNDLGNKSTEDQEYMEVTVSPDEPITPLPPLSEPLEYEGKISFVPFTSKPVLSVDFINSLCQRFKVKPSCISNVHLTPVINTTEPVKFKVLRNKYLTNIGSILNVLAKLHGLEGIILIFS